MIGAFSMAAFWGAFPGKIDEGDTNLAFTLLGEHDYQAHPVLFL